MDWSALVPLGSALASALITGGVALRVVHVTQEKTNAREKEQREQQRKLKELELQEARLQRLRDDRIKAYADFARLTYTYKITDPAAVVGVLAAYSTIELLTESSETRDAADKLRTEIIQLREAADEAEWEEEQGRTATTDAGLEYANQQVLDARDEFIRRAKDELGIDQLQPVSETSVFDTQRQAELQLDAEFPFCDCPACFCFGTSPRGDLLSIYQEERGL